jgi:hypothetical protein
MSELWQRLRVLFRRGQFDRDLEEEMQFHLEMQAEENHGNGISAEESRYAARRQFGNCWRPARSHGRRARASAHCGAIGQDPGRLKEPAGTTVNVVYVNAQGIRSPQLDRSVADVPSTVVDLVPEQVVGVNLMSNTIELRIREPHPAQEKVIREAKRFNVVCCGRRWGKTLGDGPPDTSGAAR